ncbi:LPD38 domain-containing protein [Cohnella panacarvi]|uniref:LPD38 domain-containing protein n=1 Tax=Cohnella panacarvi TaxID=400776 RepID=UPI0012EB1DD2|nr:LPD38 domain-containing protein [Cohnella panacarvi]
MRETAQAGEDGAARAASDADLLGFVPKGDKGRFTHPEDTRTYIRSGAEKEPISFENAVNNFYTNAFDNQQRINQFDKYVESVTGTPLSPEERSYYLALNSRGSDMVSNHILTEQLVNAKGDVIGQSLKDITSQIPRRAYKNFTDYLIAKHAETRMLRDETVYNRKANMTVDKVKQKIADYDRTYPEFAKIADQLYEWNEQLTKSWLVDTGIISPETAKAWKDANPYWVPNKRFFSKLERAGKGLGAKRGYGNQNNPVKKYSPTGSERDIIDPIESMIEYVDRYVKTAKRNEVMQTLIKNIRKDPESFGDFAVELKREKVEPGSLGDDGFDKLIESMDDEFNRTLRKSDIEKDNVISGLIDGERVYLRVNDPALLEALVNITPQARSKVLESARKATNLVKVLTTGINPIFSLTRNIFRDIPTAFIASKTTNNPSRFAWDLLDGVVSTFGNKDLYKRYKAVGGGHSSPVAADRDLLAQSKQSILPQTRRGLGFLPRAKSALENLSNVIESAPRLGEFKRLTEAGGDSYGSRVEGLYEANDITTNFKRHGTVSKEADAIFLYLNAALQGLDKTARIFKDKPGAAVSKSLLAVTLPTIALYALNHGDEAYENLSNYQKDNFFNIPKGDGTFIKIPRPREIGVPFGSAVERALREWVDKDPESFRDFSDTITTAFAPPGVPAKELAEGDFMGAAVSPIRDTIAGPLVDVAANENFAGAPIVPGYLEGASPRNQYDANTSEIGKKIGDILNVSPKQVDHLIRSYTGVVGQLALPASAKGGTVTDMLTKQVTADPVFTTDATRYFYELKDKVDTQYQDFKVTGEPPAGYNDAARKYLDSVASDMSDITKAIRAVDDMDLSAGEAKRMKRELTELRNTMARTAYKAVAGQQ